MSNNVRIIAGVDASAIHSSVQLLAADDEPSQAFTVQMDLDTGTATVLLYGRVKGSMGWVLFDTILLTTAGYLKSYDGCPQIGWKVTVLSAGTVKIAAAFDD